MVISYSPRFKRWLPLLLGVPNFEGQKAELKADFEEYPAQPLSIGEKLMAMLGLAKVSTVKKL